MRLFKVESKEWDGFDPYDFWKAIIVIAEDEEKALEIAKRGHSRKYPDGHDWDEVTWEFKKEQYPLKIIEINCDVEQVLLSN